MRSSSWGELRFHLPIPSCLASYDSGQTAADWEHFSLSVRRNGQPQDEIPPRHSIPGFRIHALQHAVHGDFGSPNQGLGRWSLEARRDAPVPDQEGTGEHTTSLPI